MDTARILRLALLPAASGLLCFLSFPLADQGYLAWIAYVPLLVFVVRAKSAWGVLWAGTLAGFVQFFGLLTWIPEVLIHYGGVSWYVGWILFLLLALMEAAYPAIACLLTYWPVKLRGRIALLAFPAIFVSLEWLRTHLVFGGFPWLLTGYSQTAYPRMIQLADITGVYGVTCLIALVNASLAYVVVRRPARLKTLLPLAVALALVGANFVYGTHRLDKWRRIQPRYRTALLQANISFHDPAGRLAWKSSEGYVLMADGLSEEQLNLLVLPEAPAIYSFERDDEYRDRMAALARRFEFGMIFNSIRFGKEEGVQRYFNSAYFLDGAGEVRGIYDKIHLVPFGEYIPARSLFFFAETVTKDVGDFSAGQEFVIVRMAGRAINGIICFEAVFPALVREFVRQGSGLIVNLTNDGWYGDSAAPHQHLAMTQWRAVENRRYLLRSTNSGISAIIGPTGEIQARTQLLREDVCLGGFDFIEGSTFYTRQGDVFAVACAIITGFTMLACLRIGTGVRGQTRTQQGGKND